MLQISAIQVKDLYTCGSFILIDPLFNQWALGPSPFQDKQKGRTPWSRAELSWWRIYILADTFVLIYTILLVRGGSSYHVESIHRLETMIKILCFSGQGYLSGTLKTFQAKYNNVLCDHIDPTHTYRHSKIYLRRGLLTPSPHSIYKSSK